MSLRSRSILRRLVTGGLLISSAVAVGVASPPPVAAIAGEVDLVGPTDSGCFGTGVFPLGNGNIVVTDPCWDGDIGAVHLYQAKTRTLISTLTGSAAGDKVGQGITVLSNGNFVVASPAWANGAVAGAGAATWVNGATGLNGAVSAANSLVGSQADDAVGDAVVALTNGSYVVVSAGWDNGAAIDAGAVTWGDGAAGTKGAVSSANSLVGSQSGDKVGSVGVTALTNGNYVVASPGWDDGGTADVGAATWGNGTTGIAGAVSSTNSLVGSAADDQVASSGVTALSNGDYVVASPKWDNGAVTDVGAATWGDGATGTSGAVMTANSLVGSTAGDSVGTSVTALTNGNYVVASPTWDNGATADAGAATWADGDVATSGVVAVANSLVGSSANDQVGSTGVTALSNGNYVVASPMWDGAVTDVGAATWGDGDGGTTGAVTTTNSLVGSTAGDAVGGSVTALSNGNYVVASPTWDKTPGVVDAGAATWGNGTTGTNGAVSLTNSLVGTQAGDQVGSVAPTALSNGNYVVASPLWDHGADADAGAATWGDGDTGVTGVLTLANSLVGTSPGDGVGIVTALSNGNYVVATPMWDDGAVVDVGAVTWGDGGTGTAGQVSASNSLVGSKTGDRVGEPLVMALPNGNAVVLSSEWDDAATVDAGAATPFSGTGPTTGTITADNSLIGDASDTFAGLAFEPVHQLIIVRRPAVNKLSIIAPPAYVPLVPARLLETRVGEPVGTVDGQHEGTGPVAAGTVYELPVAGRGGVADDAESVVLNVTVTETQVPGFVTVYPCGSTRPFASNLNYVPGDTIPNAVVAKVGTDGKVCLYALTTAHLIVDVNGFFPAGTGYFAQNPARLLESRPDEPGGTVDDAFEGDGPLLAGTTLELQVTGRAGIPASATAAMLNVTVTEPVGPGFLTVFPCGSPRPFASNLNYVADQTIPNAVLAKIGTGGKVCFFTQTTTHLVVDVNGYHSPSSVFVAINPERFLESRSGQPEGTVDDTFEATGVLTSGNTIELEVAGRGSVPATAAAAILNVTVTEPAGPGFVTVYPCGAARPFASNLNYATGETIPNAVIAKIGTEGRVCLFTSTTTHLVVDVNGYVP